MIKTQIFLSFHHTLTLSKVKILLKTQFDVTSCLKAPNGCRKWRALWLNKILSNKVNNTWNYQLSNKIQKNK